MPLKKVGEIKKDEKINEASKAKVDLPVIEDKMQIKNTQNPKVVFQDSDNKNGNATNNHDVVPVEGVLEIMPDGYGFLRHERLLPGAGDIYVSQSQIKRFGLRIGDYLKGQARSPRENEKYQGLLKVEEVNGAEPEKSLNRPVFSRLTPIYPNQKIILETSREIFSTRIIDLISPIGKGQRSMIVSPPKAGKTYLFKDIAKGIIPRYT